MAVLKVTPRVPTDGIYRTSEADKSQMWHMCVCEQNFTSMLSYDMFRTIVQWHLVRKPAPQFLNLVPNNNGDKVTSSMSGAESLLCSLRPHIRRSFFCMLSFSGSISALFPVAFSLVMLAECYFVCDLTTSYSHNIYPMLTKQRALSVKPK